jgi:DNA-binding SARP family transcriptional activator/tetratricopeptide (TPR) repeat protein
MAPASGDLALDPDFRVLGVLEVVAHDRLLRPGRVRGRLLAVLLLHADHPVASDRLIDLLWGEDPPQNPRGVLAAHASRLRVDLRDVADVELPPGSGSYLLRVDPERVDLHRFRQLVDEGRKALSEGDPETTTALLDEALALWRDTPFVGLDLEAGLSGEIAELTRLRLDAIVSWADAQFRLDRHAVAVARLEGLVKQEPFEERLVERLMRARYFSGDPTGAERTYLEADKRFREEVMEPSPELRALAKAIRVRDPSLAPSPSDPALTARPAVRGDGLAATPRRAPGDRERKSVTLVSIRLAVADWPDPEDVDRLLAPRLHTIRAAVAEFGGAVPVPQVVDGATLAVFGVPRTNEDDPVRAVRAALAIRDRLAPQRRQRDGVADRSVPGRVHIAVATGAALVASGDDWQVTGEVAGACARLLEAIPRDLPEDVIVVADTTRQASASSIEYASADDLGLAGWATPFWRALAARVPPEPMALTRLVDREDELHQITALFQRVRRERAPRLVTLVGEPGIGKSRLVLELARSVDRNREPVTWHRGRSLPYGQMVYGALVEVVKSQARIVETDSATSIREKLEQLVKRTFPEAQYQAWVGRNLQLLLGIGGQPDPESRQQAFAAWSRLFQAAAAERPLLLVFEDLHCADDGLLDFVEGLADRITGVPLLVVCTTRPELRERRPGWTDGKRGASMITVPPLSEAATALLLDDLLTQSDLGGTRDELVSRIGGNPLFAHEFARIVRHQQESGRHSLLLPGTELPVPDQVARIIAARLDALSPDEKALLQDAAVLGEVGPVQAIVELGDRRPRQVERLLRRLERREFIDLSSPTVGSGEYRFRHTLVRDVAYEQIPKDARTVKHQAAAAWLERLASDQLVGQAEPIAQHYLAALHLSSADRQAPEVAQRARRALRTAGDHTATLRAWPVAADYYAAALELTPPGDPERPELLFRLGRAQLHGKGAGERTLVMARNALRAADDPVRAAEAEVLLAAALLAQARWEAARVHFDHALLLVREAEPSLSKASVLIACASNLWLRGEYARALDTSRAAWEMAEQLNAWDRRAQALSHLGLARAIHGDLGGILDLQRSMRHQLDSGLLVPPSSYGNLAYAYACLGNLRGCFKAIAAGSRAASDFQSVHQRHWLEAERVFQSYWTGAWDEALTLADAFVAGLGRRWRHYMQGPCRIRRGLIRLARGDLEGALEESEVALALVHEAGSALGLEPALAFRARVLYEAGDMAEATALTGPLLAALANRPTLDPGVGVDLAIVLATVGGNEAALASKVAFSSRWSEATTAHLQGDLIGAANRYRRIGAQPEEAFLRLQAADRLLAAGRPGAARDQLQIALPFFLRAGATAYRREAEALLQEC